jgi:hypothetical protein
MGHELNVVGYTKDAKTGEVIFNIADSDDNNPNLVQRRASEIVPKIHHAGFPVKQAQKIWNDINSKLNNQYFLPDESDSKRFQLISTVPAKEQPAFLDEYQKILQEQEAQQPSADVAPQLTQPALAQQQSPLPHWQPQWQPAFMPQMYNWQAGYAVPRQTYSQQQTWQAPQPWGYTPYANTAYATYNYQYAAYGPQSSTYAIASNPFAQQQAQYYPTATGYTHPYAAYANYR